MNFKRLIQDYFTFSKKERNGILVLLAIILLLVIANQVIFLFEKPGQQDVDKFLAEVAEFEKQTQPAQQLTRFPFDPNTINPESFDSLSLPDQVKKNILRFRSKGGKFYKPEDVRKIYGMNDSLYATIEGYIIIKEKEKTGSMDEKPELKLATKPTFFVFDPNTCSDEDLTKLGLGEKQIQTFNKYKKAIGTFKSKEQFSKIYGIDKTLIDSLMNYIVIAPVADENSTGVYKKIIKTVELNTADSISLQELKGIGDKLSYRIIKYRQMLGGYHNLEQLMEVYGLSFEIYELVSTQLTVDTTKIEKLDLNFGSQTDLAKHPYIGKILARKIVEFRSKNGSIINPSILTEKKVLSFEEYKKIKPYIGTKSP